jgi:hypothetical protein
MNWFLSPASGRKRGNGSRPRHARARCDVTRAAEGQVHVTCARAIEIRIHQVHATRWDVRADYADQKSRVRARACEFVKEPRLRAWHPWGPRPVSVGIRGVFYGVSWGVQGLQF